MKIQYQTIKCMVNTGISHNLISLLELSTLKSLHLLQSAPQQLSLINSSKLDVSRIVDLDLLVNDKIFSIRFHVVALEICNPILDRQGLK